jgi:hypothetical protein
MQNKELAGEASEREGRNVPMQLTEQHVIKRGDSLFAVIDAASGEGMEPVVY